MYQNNLPTLLAVSAAAEAERVDDDDRAKAMMLALVANNPLIALLAVRGFADKATKRWPLDQSVDVTSDMEDFAVRVGATAQAAIDAAEAARLAAEAAAGAASEARAAAEAAQAAATAATKAAEDAKKK